MDNVYILNIFLIFSLLLIISLFSSYYMKLSRFTTRLEKNLEYGCDDIKRLEYTDIDGTNDNNIVLYIVDKIYESVNDNKDINILIESSNLNIKTKILDKDDTLFGLHLTKSGKDYIIFRGSYTNSDWVDIDIDVEQTKYDNTSCVHSGFYRRFKEIKPQLTSVTSGTLVIGGHSLGSPIAIFTALHYKNEANVTINTNVFALPRMGNKDFSDNHITTSFNNNNTNHTLSIYHNEADIIPQLPFTSTLNFDDKTSPFIYVNFNKIFYHDFYDARKYICTNHATKTYFDNLKEAIPRAYTTNTTNIKCS